MSIEKTFQFDKIRHLDLKAPVCVEQNASVISVISQMQKSRSNCVLVCEEKRLLGVFTTRDVLRKVIAAEVDTSTPIKNFMTVSPTTLTIDASIAEAIKLMDSSGVRHLPLINTENEVAGIISSEDIVNYLVEHFPTEVYNLPPRLRSEERRVGKECRSRW